MTPWRLWLKSWEEDVVDEEEEDDVDEDELEECGVEVDV